MPRLPRIQVKGAVYYVTAKAVQNEEIFKDGGDYKMYLELVSRYKTQHKFKLFAYSLLPDRLEMVIETLDSAQTGESGASISDIMHDLNSLYTKYYNGRYQKKGHLFEARFRSVLVEKAQYLAALTRHVHLANLRHAKTQGQSVREYPYSSFLAYAYLGSENEKRLLNLEDEVREVMDFLKSQNIITEYGAYVLDLDRNQTETLEKSLRRGQVLGSFEFEKKVKNRIKEHIQEQKEALQKKKANPVFVYIIGGLVIVATLSSIVLYVNNQNLQTKYKKLLEVKEQEFAQKSNFENVSPLALADLDGTRWSVEVVPSPRGGVLQKDSILFSGGKFSSKILEARGFRASNYFLQPLGGRVVQWQSAQSNSKGDSVVWRGTWLGDMMRGQLTLREGTRETVFLFFSVRWNYAGQSSDASTHLSGSVQ